jgi:type II pantothenate kinase
LKQRAYHPLDRPETSDPDLRRVVGVDVGATLAKIALRNRHDAAPEFDLVPSQAPAKVMEAVFRLAPHRVGLTGGGAAELARLLPWDTARVNEFAAWGSGAAALLRSNGGVPAERYLLVSLGTGTSIMLVDGMAVTRVGGTALGGGTLVGLGAQLAGERGFEELAALAAQGARQRVDLLVSDIYRPGEIPLAGELTASAFGKLARWEAGSEPPRREDLTQALMGLIGENVALLCGGLAAATQVRRIVYAGSTLRRNPTLCAILSQITLALGREPVLLQGGEFAGALGALLLAAQGH